MDKHETVLKISPRVGRRILFVQNAMLRHEPAATDPELRITVARQNPFNEFHPGPDAARILPTATGTTEPFAKNCAGKNQATLMLLQLSDERSCLPCRPHADTDER